MHNIAMIHERFMRDDLPIRIGGLAANLARISSFSRHDPNKNAVNGLIDESKWFIEWTAAQVEVDTAAQLVELQVQLARWQIDWDRRWNDPAERARIGAAAKEWSERVLEMSGLLD